jgi:predicted HAD superfamily hydrolase
MGKRIIAVSDMYLPTAFIRKILENAGYYDFENIYVSSETKVTKESGHLFEKIIGDTGVSPRSILHIGDNQRSDFEVPTAHEITSQHYISPRQRLLSGEFLNPAIFRSLIRSDDPAGSVISALCARAMAQQEGTEKDYWYWTGYCVAGPLAYGFTGWIKKRAEALNLDALYFLARDGLLPFRIYEKYFSGPPAKYLLASRRMFLIPSIEELDSEMLQFLTTDGTFTPVREFFARLDAELPDDLDARLEKYFGNPEALVLTGGDKKNLANIFKEYEDWIKKIADDERETLLAYLNTQGFVDDKRKGVIDLGWHGSSQHHLEKVIGTKDNIFGLYFGLSRRAYRKGRNNGYLFCYGEPHNRTRIVNNCIEYYELLFSGTHPSVNRVVRDGGKFSPSYVRTTSFENERLRIAEQIHEGALQFCEDFVSFLGKREIEISPEVAILPSNAVLSTPDDQDISKVGNVHHSFGLGSASYYPLISQKRVTFKGIWTLLFGGANEGREFRSYWKRGYLHQYRFVRNSKLF